MDSLHVPLKPPVLFFIALLTGVGLGYIRSWGFSPGADRVRLGMVCALFAMAVSLGAWGLMTKTQAAQAPGFIHGDSRCIALAGAK